MRDRRLRSRGRGLINIYAEAACSISAEGYSVEDATFWAPGAHLLATSRQVRLAGT